jgi:hypothetical protein
MANFNVCQPQRTPTHLEAQEFFLDGISVKDALQKLEGVVEKLDAVQERMKILEERLDALWMRPPNAPGPGYEQAQHSFLQSVLENQVPGEDVDLSSLDPIADCDTPTENLQVFYQRVKNMAAISDESFLAALKEIQLCPNGMVVSSSDAQNNAQEIGK